MKRDKRDDKPRLGHATKYINSSKEKDKDTPSKNKNNKPYAGEGGLKKLLARRKQEVIEAESMEDPDVRAMADDSEREPEFTKRTSKITEPVRSPATFARKVSAPPPLSSIPSICPRFDERLPVISPMNFSGTTTSNFIIGSINTEPALRKPSFIAYFAAN